MSSVPPKKNPPVDWVSDTIIQRLFKDGQYLERLRAGELRAKVIASRQPADLPPGEPPGTLSQMVIYRQGDGKVVAMVHQYLRPDGTIGASGKPDPKALFLDDRIVKYDPKQKEKHKRKP
jgi:hypothetical protein